MPEAHEQDGVLYFKVDFCVIIVSVTIWSSIRIKSITNVYSANILLFFLETYTL